MKNKFKFLATMLIGILLSVNVWGETATWTGSAMVTTPQGYTDHGASDNLTDDKGNVWTGRWSYEAGTGGVFRQMVQLRTYTNSTDNGNCTRISLPTFDGDIQTVVLDVTNTSATSKGGTGSTTAMYLCTAYSKSSLTSILTVTPSSATKTITFDLTSLDTKYTGEGLHICAGGGVRVWGVTVTYESAPATHYKVTFYNNGVKVGEATTETYDGEENLEELPDMTSAISPHPSSTTFAGWTTDEINGETQTTITADNLVDTYTEITEDISVNALWASVDSDHRVTFTASELSQSPVGGYYDWTIGGINFYYKQSDGTIYSSNYFEVSEGKRFTVNAGNKIINKIDFTVLNSTFCIGSMTDGSLSDVFDTNKQTATNINAYYTQGIASDDYDADFSQMVVTCYTDYITHYTACSNEVNVSKGSMTGGDITISAETVCADDGGGSVTVTPNPNAHYSCTGVTATVGSVTGPVEGVYTVSGITAATTISATFVEAAKYTVTWKVKGVTVKSTQVYVGETDAAPAVADADIPTTCANAFVGWSTSTRVGEGYGAPADLFNTTSPEITADRTFNAVFATASSGSGTVFHSQPGTITTGDYYLVDTYNGVDYQGNATACRYRALKGGLINSGTSGGIQCVNICDAVSVNDNVLTLDMSHLDDSQKPDAYTITVNESSVSFALNGTTFYCQGDNVNADMTTSTTNSYNWNEITNETGDYVGRHMLKVSHGTGTRCLMVLDHTSHGNNANWCKVYALNNSNEGGSAAEEQSYGSGKLYFIPAVSVTYSNYVTSCAVYTVTFKSNGADVTTVSNVAPGQQVTAPTLAEIQTEAGKRNACTNYLVGWSADSHYSNPSTAPIDILKPDAEGKITIPSSVTGDVTYYAVYADVVQQ